MSEYSEAELGLRSNPDVDVRRSRRGYIRQPRTPQEPMTFILNGHRFDTADKDIWVTQPGWERIDRIKITRTAASTSARRGYPRELIRTPAGTALTLETAKAAARFWLGWSATTEAGNFAVVQLGYWARQAEAA